MVFAAAASAFRQVAQCFLVTLVTIAASYLYFQRPRWCDNTLGLLGGKRRCGSLRRLLFVMLLGCAALSLAGRAY